MAWERATGEQANPVFKMYARQYTDEVEKSRKRKAKEEVKRRRITTKYRKTNDDSLRARCDYDRHDDGPSVHEVHQDVPCDYFDDLFDQQK